MMRSTHIPRLRVKEAMGSNMLKVGPRPDRWVEEVIERLIQEHPFLTQYSIMGNLVNSDPEKLYGMGFVDVRTPSESKLKQPGIRIPFVIENGMLHPMKVFLNPKGRGDLLDKDIVGEVMFSATPSTALHDPGEDPSLVGALYPPNRTRHGFGGSHDLGTVKQSSITPETMKLDSGPWLGYEAEQYIKEAGVKLSKQQRQEIHKKAMARTSEVPGSICMLDRISHTISEDQLDKLAEILDKDPHIIEDFRHTEKLGFIHALMSMEPVKEAQASHDQVVQVLRLGPAKYQIKRANVDGFEPSTDVVSSHDIKSLIGEDLVGELRADGKVTVTTQPAIQQNLDDIRVEPIEDYGIYKVQELESGDHVVGWVITNIIDLYGGSSNLKLFNSGKNYALQEDIAGVRVSQGTALPRKVPEGGDFGSFYYVSSQGRVTALLPMTITHIENNGGEQFLAFVDLWGKPGRLTMAPDLKMPVDMGEKGFAIPDTMLFMPLKKDTRIVPDPILFSKTAAADNTEIIYNGSFHFRGPTVEKVSQVDKHYLDSPDAEFLGVALGLTPAQAQEKIAEAYVTGQSSFVGRRLITKEERAEKIASIQEKVASRSTSIKHLQKDTVKLASLLPDMAMPQSVDAVLSLNFVNQENLMLFIESLPHLEVARRDLAELYLSTLVGLPDVSSAAILRAMENLAEVIKGLRKVRMRAMMV